jgi:hypothetical protein
MQEILIYRSLLSNGESTGVFLLYINQKMITRCATGQLKNYGVLGKNLKDRG